MPASDSTAGSDAAPAAAVATVAAAPNSRAAQFAIRRTRFPSIIKSPLTCFYYAGSRMQCRAQDEGIGDRDHAGRHHPSQAAGNDQSGTGGGVAVTEPL